MINSSDYWTNNLYMKNYDETLPKPFRMKSKYNVEKKKLTDNDSQYNLINNIFDKTKPKKISIDFDKKTYEIIYDKNVYVIFYKLTYIIITINENIASINNIIGHKNQYFEKSLFEMTIKFIKENEEELDISSIMIHDTTYKIYKNKKLKFCDLYMLTHGETWYYKHGFYPCDDKIFEKMIISKNIINNTIISQVKNLSKYIDKYGGNKKKEINNNINIIKNKNIKELFRLLEKEYLELYYKIYKKIMKELKIDSFFGINYCL